MKKLALTLITAVLFLTVKAQTTPGPKEAAMTDSICNCLTKVDLKSIKDKAGASAVFTDCFGKYAGLLVEVAEEKHVDVTDKAAMRQVGVDIGKNLFKQNCNAFTQISMKMASDEIYKDTENGVTDATTGVFKRIENKGFNYIVANSQGKEKSFLWFGQFQGSEKFVGSVMSLVGKKIKITWKETEAYLPVAKGYYPLKEITAIDIL
ncbi:MAG: hypothetical protein JKY70_14780 [Mucilaginibacter sp.]|nr:hypothetical protein [Mucilaginibacter sp.]